MIKLLEILRFTGCGVGIFLAYYFGESPEGILRIMTPWFVGSVAGLSAVEGLFFSRQPPKKALNRGVITRGRARSGFSLLQLRLLSSFLQAGTNMPISVWFLFFASFYYSRQPIMPIR